MHDLSSALSAWRLRFESEHELGREHVDELESHVAESAEELATRGLDAEEAVLIAAHRLGTGDALRAEYAKVHPLDAWSKRVQWMLAGYLGISALVVATRALSDAATAMVDGRLIRTDQPVSRGGEGEAPDPYSLFLASLATCAGYYVLAFCRARSLSTEGLRITQTSDTEANGSLRVVLTIELPSSFPAQYVEAVRLAAASCKVKKALALVPSITIEAHRATQAA